MMDVLMTVLTFFIIISMTLTGQQILDISVPKSVKGIKTQEQSTNDDPEPLIVGLDSQGQIILDNEVVTFPQLRQRVKQHRIEYPDGSTILKADRELAYAEVAKFLDQMRAIGGNRISLAVEDN